MQCDQNSVALGTYLDGELPSDQAAAVQEHIGVCPQCAAEIAELVRLQRSLRPARNHFAPSAEFRRKIQRQIALPERRRWRMPLVPAGVALAALLVFIALGWMQHSRRADAFSEVADLHVDALASANPLDVVSSDRHTVKPWFQGKIPFSFNLPELAGSEFTLLGGRLVYLHQRPCAQLIVGLRQHKISVLIFQTSPEMVGLFSYTGGVRRSNSFSSESWKSQGLEFFVIGDTDPNAIGRLADLFKRAND